MFTAAFRMFAAAVLVCIAASAVAQTIPPSDQPGRERQRFTEPPPVLSQPGGAAVTLPSTVAPAGAAQVKLVVHAIRITGATVYPTAELEPLYSDLIGHEISLKDVYELAQCITAKYGNDGYVLSRAIVPPQQLSPRGAVVHIQVIEGYIDRVEWPAELSHYRDLFSYYAARITSDRPANIRTMERYLLLASDLPGLKFSTSLRPSDTETGASTLVVAVAEKRIDAFARGDNRGTAARGPNEFQSSLTVNNLLGAHESVSGTYAGAMELGELQYAEIDYRQVLTGEGLSLFANASYGWGNPGTQPLQILDYATLSTVVEGGLSYPVIRSRERNLTLMGLFFLSDNSSDVLDAPFNDDRLRGIRLNANGDAADFVRGVNQYNFTLSQGIDGLGSTNNNNPLASRAGGRVDFTKLEGNVSHIQPLGGNFSALLAAYGQYAFVPLLSPEQCGYGGRYFGRAFDPSQLTGDECAEVSGELRYDLRPVTPQLSLTQLYGFVDYGRVWNKDPSAGTPATLDGTSAGGGVRLGWRERALVDLSVADAIEGPPEGWRFFFSVTGTY
jgi:hemolysin activation/secretion protein